MYSMNRIL